MVEIQGAFTQVNTPPVADNLGTSVDGDGIPTVASGGQSTGTTIIANPVLDDTANQALAVSDVTYTTGDAVLPLAMPLPTLPMSPGRY